MTDVVDELLSEHRDIRKVLQVLSDQLDVMREPGDPDWELLKDAMYYLTQYPDLFHHACEDLVFRRLHQRDKECREFVRDLTREHGLLRELGLALLELCEDALEDRLVSKARLESLGRRYLAAQQRHMRKEEETVFPRIRRKLTVDDWDAVQRGLQHIQSSRLGGQNVRDEFRRLHSCISPDRD